MTVQWPQLLADWITPEATLDNWRERLAYVEAGEAAAIAELPYVKGLAVIGSVGRADPWPLSDVDLLAAADFWEGHDPEDLLRAVEKQRNDRLHDAKVPNDVEVGNWVVLSADLAAAAEEDDDAFYRRVRHRHWLGIVFKSAGGRVAKDFGGCMDRFLDRCNDAVFGDRFAAVWLDTAIGEAGRLLARAGELVGQGDCPAASLQVLRAAIPLGEALYAVWRRLPQSLSRGVTRLLAAAAEEGDAEVAECYLAAARLSPQDVWRRFAAAPPAGKRERDVWYGVRRRAGEDIGELAATRDLLQLIAHLAVRGDCRPPLPEWLGLAADAGEARGQMEAAEQVLGRLRRAREKLAT